MESEKTYWKASIRVVKSIIKFDGFFNTLEVVNVPIIEAETKDDVKAHVLKAYPQFFQNDNLYQRETKDEAQFFYVVIDKLSNWQLGKINEGEWSCKNCETIHENKYIYRPRYTTKPPFQDLLFCDNNACFDEYKKDYYKDVELPDDEYHVKSDSLNYIYKCTEKSTDKSYIGKTRNAPFFRWWNHLTHSSSPFGMYLRTTKLSDWTFEVLEELPSSMKDSEVLKVESEYILKFNCLEFGFNSTISCKEVVNDQPDNQVSIYDQGA